MKVVNVGDDINGIYEHSFEKNAFDKDLYSNGITEGNYVLISTDKRTAIASGFVTSLTPITISVSLERYLLLQHIFFVFL